VRGIAVGDLREMNEARVVEVGEQRLEEAPARLGTRRRRAAADAHPGLDEPAHEPRPDRPLVIRGVALARAALVAGRVAGLARRERAEAERGHEPRLDRVDHTPGLLPLDHRERQAADGEYLVRAERPVDGAGPVIDVGEMTARLVPEARREGAP